MIYAVYFIGQTREKVLVATFLMKSDAIYFLQSSSTYENFIVVEVDGYEHFSKIRNMIEQPIKEGKNT